MKHYILFFSLAILVSFSSCVPHKDLIYAQNKEKALDSTTVLREAPKPYRIQINDILNVRVKALEQDKVSIYNPIGDENLNASGEERAYFDGFTVDLHGNIRIPVLGKINVLGYTIEEVQELIEKRLLEDQFNEAANIFVTVKLAGLRFTAMGEINRPGSTVMFQERVNIFQAIAEAGEIPVTGNRKDVLVIRQYPQGQQIHHLDLTDVDVMNSPYYYIQNNDMIYVKPLKQKVWGTGQTGTQTLTTIITVVGFLTTTVLLIDRL